MLPLLTGKDEPKAPTLHIKPKEPKSFVTPSPGAYNPDAADKDVKISAPKYSFGIKTKAGKAKEVPAPNAYTIAKVSLTKIFKHQVLCMNGILLYVTDQR